MHENYMIIQEMKFIVNQKQAADQEKAAGNEKGVEILLREMKG